MYPLKLWSTQNTCELIFDGGDMISYDVTAIKSPWCMSWKDKSLSRDSRGQLNHSVVTTDIEGKTNSVQKWEVV